VGGKKTGIKSERFSYAEFQKELGKQEARFGKIIEDYARNYENMTDEAARRLLDDYLADRIPIVK